MKRILALALCLALLFALCACGGATIQAYSETTPAETDAADTDAAALDWASAWAAHDPDDVVFTIDGSAATWRELFYEVAYCTVVLQNSAGKAVTDWDALISADDGSSVTVDDYVRQSAVSVLEQYHVVYDHLTAAGVALSEEELAAVAAKRQTAIDDSFDGSEEDFLAYLDSLFCTDELWNWFNEVDALYAAGFTQFFGEDGANLSDEETLAYAENYDYVQLRLLYVYTDAAAAEDTAAADSAAASGEATASGEAAADVQAMLAELEAAAGDPAALEAAFDALYAAHNENAELDAYGASRCVYQGDVDDAIYNAAAALDDYGAAIAEIDGAEVLILRVPVEADANVYYDDAAGIMYDLRYYAAWQAYSDLINGSDGWLANAAAEWVSPFTDSFTLKDVF